MKMTFIKAVCVILSVVFLTSFSTGVQAQDEEDLLINQPLTWSINSIQIVWSVSQDSISTLQTRYIYGSSLNNVKTKSSETTASFRIRLLSASQNLPRTQSPDILPTRAGPSDSVCIRSRITRISA